MLRRLQLRRFLRSKVGSSFAIFVLFCALLSAGVGYGTYSLGLRWYTANKSEEKITALQLVDAFVSNYSSLRSQFRSDEAPVPASFRAHSIELFNQMRSADDVLRLLWVGRPGRSIATPPADAAMAETIEGFAHNPAPKAESSFLTTANGLMFRTVYPSIAVQQSCVDCHNALQPEQRWRLNDVMGAFSIDVPAGPFLRSNLLQSGGLALAIFIILGGVGLAVAVLSFRQLGEREAAQARLKQSEERFRDFAESSSDWFWEQDHNLRFISLSDPVERSGLSIDAHIGKTRREVVFAGVTEEQWQAHQADLDDRHPFQNFRFQRQALSGEIRNISVSGKPVFDERGMFRGYRGTAKDVTAEVANELELARRVEARTTELRAAQEELIRKERLSVLGQLTATVAHELRNPLSVIRNSVFAVRDAISAHKLSLDRPLARIERGITRCDRIIADLLDYTRRRELQRSALVFDQWLKEVLDEQEMPADVSLVRNLQASGVPLHFDPERLRRVMQNLIENAVQAIAPPSGERKGGRVTVSTKATEDGGVQIDVEDTGPGMEAGVLGHVFEPLFSTKNFGTGLGLPMVKQVVEQHDGDVVIMSAPGKGTRVIVSLPSGQAGSIAA